MVLGAWFEWTLIYRDVATGGPGRPWSLHFNFQTKKVPTVSVSNIWDISFYGCLKITQTRNFIIFTVYATIFEQFMVAFHFFLLHREIDQTYSRWNFSKGPIVNPGPPEKFLIVDHLKEDHDEQEF